MRRGEAATLATAAAICCGAKWWTICPAPLMMCSTLFERQAWSRLDIRLKTTLSPSPAMITTDKVRSL